MDNAITSNIGLLPVSCEIGYECKMNEFTQRHCCHAGTHSFILQPSHGHYVLNEHKNCATIGFYMGVKQVPRRTLKGFIWVLCET